MVDNQDELSTLKLAARRFAKDMDISHSNALDVVAQICDFPSWPKLTKAHNKGWRPTWLQVERAECLKEDIEAMKVPRDTSNDTEFDVRGHKCTVTEDFMDVVIWGERWSISLGHAPSEPANVEKFGPCAIDDPEALAGAMKLLMEAADRMRDRIRADWKATSFTADEHGRMCHPLFEREPSADWYCLHCDRKHNATEMAANMWHCPKCSATPIDIFPTPFWKEPLPS